jgi:hypothetical protein
MLKKCYNKEGHCLHWFRSKVDGIPRLGKGTCVLADEKKEDKKEGGCANVWGLLSSKYAEQIRQECPKPTYAPCGPRPMVTISHISGDKFMEDVKDEVYGDCRVMWTRSAFDHSIKKIFFTKKNSHKSVDIVSSPISFGVDEQLCLSFGGSPWHDVYYSLVPSLPNSSSVTYTKITTTYLINKYCNDDYKNKTKK